MLKKRIIPLLLWSDGRLVKTKVFSSQRVVGDVVKTCKVYSDQDSDEIVLLNIDNPTIEPQDFLTDVRRLSQEIMMPITVGGGISDLSRAHEFFDAGADKILVNSVAYEKPELLKTLVATFGSQAVMSGIDFQHRDDSLVLVSERGLKIENRSLSEHLRILQEIGVGEFLIQSVNRDGTRTGYDLAVAASVLRESDVPIIVAGGAGTFSHLLEALELGVDGVACGSLFNFGDNNPIRAKAYLRNYGVPLKTLV